MQRKHRHVTSPFVIDRDLNTLTLIYRCPSRNSGPYLIHIHIHIPIYLFFFLQQGVFRLYWIFQVVLKFYLSMPFQCINVKKLWKWLMWDTYLIFLNTFVNALAYSLGRVSPNLWKYSTISLNNKFTLFLL